MKSVRVEAALSYRIPLIEGLLAVVTFIAAMSMSAILITTMNFQMDIGDPLYNGTERVRLLEQIIDQCATTSYALALDISWAFFIVLIPLFFAFTFARWFEDTTLRTVLSYPVSRTALLAVKIVMSVAVISLPALLVPLFLIIALLPAGACVNLLGLFSISVVISIALISSTSMLISVILRSASATAVAGILLWAILSYLVSLPDLPTRLLMLCSPTKIVANYALGLYSEMAYSEVILMLLGSCGLLVLLVLVGVMVFRRVEV